MVMSWSPLFSKSKKLSIPELIQGWKAFLPFKASWLNGVSRLGLFDTSINKEYTIPVVLAYNSKL